MKAIAVFPKTNDVRLIDHPEPKLSSPTDVKLKIIEVGICGTDREIWGFKYGTPPDGSDYLVTGHEALGQVVEIGSAVKSLKVGDYVVPTVRRGCPEQCISCANGQPDFCFTGHFKERGIKQLHGYMTEFIVDDERYMTVVPPELKDVAVLLEPLTIAEKAIMEIFHIQSRLHWECRIDQGRTEKTCHHALVLGAGPVGLLGAMALRRLNMDVHVVARSPAPNAKAELAQRIGAPYHATSVETPQAIAQALGNIDVVFEATGVSQVAFDFLPVLGVNGIFIFTGVPETMKSLSLDAGTLMRTMVLQNQVVLGTVNAPKVAFENGLRDLQGFLEAWPTALKALITQRLPFERFAEAKGAPSPSEIKTVFRVAAQ